MEYGYAGKLCTCYVTVKKYIIICTAYTFFFGPYMAIGQCSRLENPIWFVCTCCSVIMSMDHLVTICKELSETSIL